MEGNEQTPALHVGDIVEGTVTGIMPFGAFVTANGVSGMVHISEVADTFVKDIHDYLAVGDKIKVKVISTENGRVSLSVKKAQPRDPVPAPPPPPPVPEDFEARLSRFMKDSEDRQIDVRRNRDNHRKSSGRR